MKTDIIRVHYTKLWNSEFPGAVQRTISIAGKYKMDEMHLGKSYGELTAFVPQLAGMVTLVRKNEKLEEAAEIDVERDTLIRAAVNIVKAFEPVQIPWVRGMIDIVSSLFERHAAGSISAASLSSETERIGALEKDYLASEAIRTATQSFGLSPIMERLFAANREYETLFRDYIAGKSAEPRIDIPALRSACSKALGQFFDAVQYCAYQHDSIDYLPLVNELNTLNSYYRTRLKARATLRKNSRSDRGETIQPPAEE
ncbi:MAG: DUF6261 family protein [Bacteroidales bacterium]|jgi:hypothetical protein|nr:DUF6261 family protein [Bacteroidales bacterium]